MATERSFLVSGLRGQTRFTGVREDACLILARFYFILNCTEIALHGGFVENGVQE